jgi:hypothetical protein
VLVDTARHQRGSLCGCPERRLLLQCPNNIGGGQKSALAALITAVLPVINPLIDKVLAIPGVSGIAKPAIDSLRVQLDALAKI